MLVLYDIAHKIGILAINFIAAISRYLASKISRSSCTKALKAPTTPTL